MLGFLLGLAALFPNTVFESVYSIPKTEGKTPPVFFSGCRKSQRLFRQPEAADITCPPPYGAYPSLRGNLRLSAHIGGERLVDLGLQCLRLLLFRNSTHDGVTHDVAVPVNHIGGGIGKDIGGELSRLTI